MNANEIVETIASSKVGPEFRRFAGRFRPRVKISRIGLSSGASLHAQAPLHWDAIEDDRPVRYAREPLASPWRRWVIRLLGDLAPEDLL